MKETLRTTHTYDVVSEDGKRWATIVFDDGKFNACDYHLTQTPYTLDDWEFIHKLSARILELEREHKEEVN